MVAWFVAAALAQEAPEVIVREPPGGFVLSGPARKASWVVRYEDGTPMTTGEFLRAVGAEDRFAEFDRLQRRDLGTGVGLAVGGTVINFVGSVVLGAGAAYLAQGDATNGTPLAVGGGVAALGGAAMIYGSIAPWMNRSRREKDPSWFLPAEEADALIAAHAAGSEPSPPSP